MFLLQLQFLVTMIMARLYILRFYILHDFIRCVSIRLRVNVKPTLAFKERDKRRCESSVSINWSKAIKSGLRGA